MTMAWSIRVLVTAPTASLTAQIASDVRSAGFRVAGERHRVDERALDGIDVLVVAAGTVVSPDAFADGGPGVVVVGGDPVILDVLDGDGARAVGVVRADADARTIGAAIGAVAAGLSVRPSNLTIGDGVEDPIDTEALTARESEVLDLLAQGLSNRGIAARLGISGHTVKFHLASIFGKLGVRTRTSAVRRALRRGLIDL